MSGTYADLEARHRSAVRRYWRALADADGEPPAALLAELAVIAAWYASESPSAPRRRKAAPS